MSLLDVPLPPVPAASSPALAVTLPGGLRVLGVAPNIGADALTQARAILGAANAALAPLGPAFAIIDALLAVKRFADAVPGVVTNPGDVVTAVQGLAAKIGRLASLVPQLSVPLMVLGFVDLAIAFLNGLAGEMANIAAQEERVAAARSLSSTLPGAAQAALVAVADASTAQLDVRRADVASALGHIAPILEIIGVFCELIGLPKPSVDVDPSGDTAAVAASLASAAAALAAFRHTIPI